MSDPNLKVAKQYFTQAPTIGNLWNGVKSVGRALDNTLTDHNPYLITGTAPTPAFKAKSIADAAKMVKKPTGILRNGQGKRTSTIGAITADDVFEESRNISGLGVKKSVKPFVSNGPTLNNIIHHANNYIRENKLKTIIASNGKTYVKMPDGKLKSLESLGRDVINKQGYY